MTVIGEAALDVLVRVVVTVVVGLGVMALTNMLTGSEFMAAFLAGALGTQVANWASGIYRAR